MKQMPSVSIILLNLRQYELTASCLRSLRKITYPNVEIIVVDQASGDLSAENITATFPEVTLVQSPSNLGFTGGNNLGMARASGEYLLLLNNDTEVDPGFLEPLIEFAEKTPEAGALSPMIRYHSNPAYIQYAGGPDRVDLVFGRSSWRGWMTPDVGQFSSAIETTLAHGAAFLVKREVINKVGMFDDRFFIYYEEIDWSLRIRHAGYKIFFVPSSKVFHKESMTVGKVSTFRTFYMTRNRIFLNKKHASRVDRWIFSLYITFVSLPVNTVRHLIARRGDLARAYARGFAEGIALSA